MPKFFSKPDPLPPYINIANIPFLELIQSLPRERSNEEVFSWIEEYNHTIEAWRSVSGSQASSTPNALPAIPDGLRKLSENKKASNCWIAALYVSEITLHYHTDHKSTSSTLSTLLSRILQLANEKKAPPVAYYFLGCLYARWYEATLNYIEALKLDHDVCLSKNCFGGALVSEGEALSPAIACFSTYFSSLDSTTASNPHNIYEMPARQKLLNLESSLLVVDFFPVSSTAEAQGGEYDWVIRGVDINPAIWIQWMKVMTAACPSSEDDQADIDQARALMESFFRFQQNHRQYFARMQALVTKEGVKVYRAFCQRWSKVYTGSRVPLDLIKEYYCTYDAEHVAADAARVAALTSQVQTLLQGHEINLSDISDLVDAGEIYVSLQDFDKALAYYSKALEKIDMKSRDFTDNDLHGSTMRYKSFYYIQKISNLSEKIAIPAPIIHEMFRSLYIFCFHEVRSEAPNYRIRTGVTLGLEGGARKLAKSFDTILTGLLEQLRFQNRQAILAHYFLVLQEQSVSIENQLLILYFIQGKTIGGRFAWVAEDYLQSLRCATTAVYYRFFEDVTSSTPTILGALSFVRSMGRRAPEADSTAREADSISRAIDQRVKQLLKSKKESMTAHEGIEYWKGKGAEEMADLPVSTEAAAQGVGYGVRPF